MGLVGSSFELPILESASSRSPTRVAQEIVLAFGSESTGRNSVRARPRCNSHRALLSPRRSGRFSRRPNQLNLRGGRGCGFRPPAIAAISSSVNSRIDSDGRAAFGAALSSSWGALARIRATRRRGRSSSRATARGSADGATTAACSRPMSRM